MLQQPIGDTKEKEGETFRLLNNIEGKVKKINTKPAGNRMVKSLQYKYFLLIVLNSNIFRI